MNQYENGERVTMYPYGAGTVLRPHGEHQVVVQFDDYDGFHGRKPLIVQAYSLRRI
jgi:hypothetical protein